eukprot:1237043-Rhodomonas_salina.1
MAHAVSGAWHPPSQTQNREDLRSAQKRRETTVLERSALERGCVSAISQRRAFTFKSAAPMPPDTEKCLGQPCREENACEKHVSREMNLYEKRTREGARRKKGTLGNAGRRAGCAHHIDVDACNVSSNHLGCRKRILWGAHPHLQNHFPPLCLTRLQRDTRRQAWAGINRHIRRCEPGIRESAARPLKSIRWSRV